MQLREQYAAFQDKNVILLVISNEDQARSAKLKADLDLPFLVLSDPTRDTIQAYGVFHQHEPKDRPIARPATVVIDASGTIRYRYVGLDPQDRPTPEAILAAVDDTVQIKDR